MCSQVVFIFFALRLRLYTRVHVPIIAHARACMACDRKSCGWLDLNAKECGEFSTGAVLSISERGLVAYTRTTTAVLHTAVLHHNTRIPRKQTRGTHHALVTTGEPHLELDGLVLQHGIVGHLELELLPPGRVQSLLADSRALKQTKRGLGRGEGKCAGLYVCVCVYVCVVIPSILTAPVYTFRYILCIGRGSVGHTGGLSAQEFFFLAQLLSAVLAFVL